MCTDEQRASGRTTREIDEIIQKLFTAPFEWHLIEDHYFKACETAHPRSNRLLMEKIISRLEFEHRITPGIKAENNKLYLGLEANRKNV